MKQQLRNVPPGIRLLHSFTKRKFSFAFYRGSVLILTFLCYAAFHASRKPPSIVKRSAAGAQGPLFGKKATDLPTKIDSPTRAARCAAMTMVWWARGAHCSRSPRRGYLLDSRGSRRCRRGGRPSTGPMAR